MGQNVENTIKEMQELSKTHKRVAVAYSGGKDSMVVLDLAMRFFEKVVPYYMYFVPGLWYDQNRMEFCKQRFGLDVLLYPHYHTMDALQTFTYVDPIPEIMEFNCLNRRDLYDAVKRDTGATLVLNGQKKSDGAFRRRIIANTKRTLHDVYLPLKNWLKWEVLSYLKSRDLPVPDQAASDNSGISLSVTEILYMYDNCQHDYEILRSYFPYIEAVVVRRELFGRTDG